MPSQTSSQGSDGGEVGASPADAGRAAGADAPEPVVASRPVGSIPDAWVGVRPLIARCEAGEGHAAKRFCIMDAITLTCSGTNQAATIQHHLDNGAYMDAAIALLPPKAVWRKYTDRCFTVYGASPFNAAMQERFDGFGDCDPLTLTAAFLRMHFAKLLAGKVQS